LYIIPDATYGARGCAVLCVCCTAVTDKPLTFQQKLQSFLIREYYVPRENIVKELVAGLVVGLAVVPEAIAFALVVGILPQVRQDSQICSA
jgi:hypothetical protein